MRYFYLASLALLLALSNTGRSEESRIEAIKALLSGSSSIDELIFRKRDLYQPDFPGAPKIDTNLYSLYIAKWQAGDFTLREIHSANVLADSGALTNGTIRAHGKSGAMFWKMIGDSYYYWEDKEGKFISNCVPLEFLPKDQDVLGVVSMVRGIVQPLVSLGLPEYEAGSLTWSGNTYTAQTCTGKLLKGGIIIDSGVPVGIRYQVGADETVIQVDLEYDEEHRGGIPRRLISTLPKPDGSKMLFYEYIIDSVHFAPKKMPVELFSGKEFQISGYTKIIRTDHGVLFPQTADGSVVAIGRKPSRPIVFWFLAGLMSLPVGWIIFRAAVRRRNG